jgi:hypothetical protein
LCYGNINIESPDFLILEIREACVCGQYYKIKRAVYILSSGTMVLKSYVTECFRVLINIMIISIRKCMLVNCVNIKCDKLKFILPIIQICDFQTIFDLKISDLLISVAFWLVCTVYNLLRCQL